MASVDLTGEVAVVTGASGRLGTVWLNCLLRAGAAVAGIDTREQPAGSVAATTAESAGDYLHLVADVTDRASLEASLRACTDQLGNPSIVVNNAGLDSPPATDRPSWRFEDIPDEVSSLVLDVNTLGVLRMCQVYGSVLVRQGRGSIVNIGSLYGSVAPNPALYRHLDLDPPFLKPPAYGVSKAGTAALTRYLAALWGPAGVRVNTLSPGGVLADQDTTFQREFVARTPMARMAVAGDLTGPLLFLVSGLSSYVTGQELVVDGGYTCW